MAITAKLSRKLYETFGDEAAGDMVDWMNRIDAQRAELRELNELNFSRLDERMTRFDERMDRFEERMDRFELRLEGLDRDMNTRFAQMEATIVGRLEAKIEQRTADLMKWSFVFWVGAVTAIAMLAGVLG